ncbi:MAG: DUF4837 family protein [Saprospiraceae bacterium]|nr:DUF4837 family protein [Saprospiraceae bacterium]
MKNFGRLLLIIFLASSLSNCTEETRKRLAPTPIAIGSLNQVAIVCDQDIWQGPIGDSISFYFGSAYPILPQPEPWFDLKHFTPEELDAEPTRRELKAYVIIGDILDEGSLTQKLLAEDIGSERVRRASEESTYNTSVAKDKWAKGQQLIYLFAKGRDGLQKAVVDNFPAMAKIIQKYYEPQIDATVYLGGSNGVAINTVQKQVKAYINVPTDYKIALEEQNTIWLRQDTDDATSNILIHRLPYTDQNQFEKEYVLNIRNQLGKELISTTIEGTYMQTNDVDLPVFISATQISNAYAVEARGIWEMVGEFLGGPFISYLVLDEENSELLFIDAFVLAPGERKRNLMLYLEHIVSTLKL